MLPRPLKIPPCPINKGKARQEKILRESGLAYSIVRPTLVFGREDILVNNIAWLIRKFPVFPIPGDGQYRVQPLFVEDLASIAVGQGTTDTTDECDAIGPETYTYEEFVRLIASALGKADRLRSRSPRNKRFFLGKVIGGFLRDVILTKDELRGLMNEHLTSMEPPLGQTKFSDWLEANKASIGGAYSSELDRHFRWSADE